MSSKQTYFTNEWLQKLEYKGWLEAGADDTTAYCKKCRKHFKLSNMGETAIKSHLKGPKHVKNSESIVCYFKSKPRPEPQAKDNIKVNIPETVDNHDASLYFEGHDVAKAETRWALKVAMATFSNNSNKDNNLLFSSMFPDSNIANKFQMGPNKISYTLNFGLSPYFKNLLLNEVTQADWYLVGFDESLNDSRQNCQMNLNLRFWNCTKNEVEICYWDSQFLGHSTAAHIFKNFTSSLNSLKKSSMLQVSMDGPSTNWAFLDLLTADREAEELPKLVNIGSCGLHIVHGAFKTGFESVDWAVKNTLKGCYNLFHDSPARRDDYVSVSGSDIFPLSFCAT